jgi:hypothetical protein
MISNGLTTEAPAFPLLEPVKRLADTFGRGVWEDFRRKRHLRDVGRSLLLLAPVGNTSVGAFALFPVAVVPGGKRSQPFAPDAQVADPGAALPLR